MIALVVFLELIFELTYSDWTSPLVSNLLDFHHLDVATCKVCKIDCCVLC
jgi:galactitol-specific phosphotransferase system IIC component